MLEHLFGSKTRIKLLQIFFRSPHQAFYVRELSRLAEMQLNAVRRELNNLLALGIIRSSTSDSAGTLEIGTGRCKYFQLESGSLLITELKALLLKAELLEERELIELLKKRAGAITLLILTGIFTSASEVDTDLLLVGKIKPLAVSKIIKDYEGTTGKVIRYTILDDREFKDRHEIGDKFLYSVLEAKHIVAVDEQRKY